MRLTINLVTRGRPERLLDTVERTLPLLGEASTQLVISIDDDDQPTRAVADRLRALDGRIIIDSRPREDALGAKWDRGLDYRAGCYFP
jgi:hypothetical protein